MKRNGFTLIELIGVLTLLALIALIALPNVDSVIKKSKKNSLNAVKKTLETSTRSWITDNKDLFINSGDVITITLRDLKEAGLVDFDIKNPVSQACLSNENQISIKWVKDLNNNKYEITVNEDLMDDTIDSDGDGILDDCNAVKKSPKIYLVGTNPVNIPFGGNINLLSENISGTDTDGMDVIAKNMDNEDITRNVTVSYSFTTGTTKVLKNGIMTYTVTANGVTKNLNRTVNIVDEIAPVLSGVKDNVVLDLSVESYTHLTGVTASDNYDGDITNKIVVKSNLKLGEVGSYYATYTVKDTSGNVATKTTNITIKN